MYATVHFNHNGYMIDCMAAIKNAQFIFLFM